MANKNRRGCPNLNIVVEGKGFLSSGTLVAKCRAQQGATMAPDQVKRLCYHGPGNCSMSEMNNTKDIIIPSDQTPSYTSCRYNKGMYR